MTKKLAEERGELCEDWYLISEIYTLCLRWNFVLWHPAHIVNSRGLRNTICYLETGADASVHACRSCCCNCLRGWLCKSLMVMATQAKVDRQRVHYNELSRLWQTIGWILARLTLFRVILSALPRPLKVTVHIIICAAVVVVIPVMLLLLFVVRCSYELRVLTNT